MASEIDRLQHLRLDHLAAGPKLFQLARILRKKRERAIVTRNNRLEIEERVGGVGRARLVHGEMSANAQYADLRPVQRFKDRHIRHHVRVARDINRAVVMGDHEARLRSRPAITVQA